MATLTDLRENIEADTRRTLGAVGTRFINDAIRHYAGRRWWFNEMVSTTATVAGTETYAIPTGMRSVDTVSIEVTTGDPFLLTYRDHAFIEGRRVSSTIFKGIPQDYTIYDELIRLYPIPEAAYVMRITGYGELVDSFTNTKSPWANEAYNLIYSRARALIERDYFYNPEGYAMHSAAERDALRELQAENTRRMARGRFRGWGL